MADGNKRAPAVGAKGQPGFTFPRWMARIAANPEPHLVLPSTEAQCSSTTTSPSLACATSEREKATSTVETRLRGENSGTIYISKGAIDFNPCNSESPRNKVSLIPPIRRGSDEASISQVIKLVNPKGKYGDDPEVPQRHGSKDTTGTMAWRQEQDIQSGQLYRKMKCTLERDSFPVATIESLDAIHDRFIRQTDDDLFLSDERHKDKVSPARSYGTSEERPGDPNLMPQRRSKSVGEMSFIERDGEGLFAMDDFAVKEAESGKAVVPVMKQANLITASTDSSGMTGFSRAKEGRSLVGAGRRDTGSNVIQTDMLGPDGERLTLTQAVLSKALPTNWFFTRAPSESGDTPDRKTEMREINAWSPQQL